MDETQKIEGVDTARTRRQLLAGSGIGLATLASASSVLGRGAGLFGQTTKDDPDKLRTSIHEEVEFTSTAGRIYSALLVSKQFSNFTGMSAEIDPREGGTFKMFGGLIVGRNIELVHDKRIVQAWRASYWKPGFYTLVKFELEPNGAKTTLVLDHTGFQEGQYGSLHSGWEEHYWTPLRKFLSLR